MGLCESWCECVRPPKYFVPRASFFIFTRKDSAKAKKLNIVC